MRSECSDSFSEAREQDSELGIRAQKKTRDQPVKNWRVIRGRDLCVIFWVWDCGSFCAEIRCYETISEDEES
jgi:hypothetical protein